MEQLRDPENGCPWDREQDFHTIAPYTIEEAYEVADAIDSGDREAIRSELGDLLFQVAFYAQMGRERGWFGFDEIVDGICEKMVRRHPHVFADVEVADAEAQSLAWEQHKAAERADSREQGLLAGVALGLPALLRSEKLQKRAAKVGFDWPDIQGVLAKLDEERSELHQEIDQGADPRRLEEELGDLLFSCVNLGRHLGVSAEQALRHANRKFERRFAAVEAELESAGESLQQAGLERLDRLWNQVKQQEQGD